MEYPPVSVILVRDYMSHFAAAENEPFNDNYAAAVAPFVIDVSVPTAALVPDDVSWKIYSVSGDVPTAFLLWLATPGVAANVEPVCIVLLHSFYQFVSRMGRPSTK